MQNLKVRDIMTTNLVTVRPDDLVVYAAKLFWENRFNGLPVVIDEQNNIIGILTEYDLISQGNVLHLPTLINMLSDIENYKKDEDSFKDAIKNLLSLRVEDIMNREPITIEVDAWIQEAFDLFANHHRVNPIPVIDKDKKLVGILSRFDLIKVLSGERDNQDVDDFVKNFKKKFNK